MPEAGTSRMPRSTRVSVSLASLALVVVAWVTASSADGLAARNAVALADGDLDASVLAADRDAVGIALRNLAAVALLAAGAPTMATLTLLAVVVLGTGLGLSGAAVLAALGPAETLARVGPYLGFELAAVVLATAAGLLPTVHAVIETGGRRPSVRFPTAYARALPASLALTALAAALVVVAACIEAVVIAGHPR